MKIRDAIEEDATAACIVLQRSIEELCEADHRSDPKRLASWLANKTVENFVAWMRQPDNSVLVAVEDEALMAVGSVSDKGRVGLNYVSPDHRFEGISDAMLSALEERAAERGNTICKLESTETARRFYLSRGYVEIGSPERTAGALSGYPMFKAIVPAAASPDAARHKTKMAHRKAVQDAEVASKAIAAKGLLMVHTGPGKGKSTAAFGLVLRALGRGWNVGIVQFIKGAWDTGERHALEAFGDRVTWRAMGEGFTWETQDRERDIAAAGRAWDVACAMLDDPAIRLVVLDELNIALRYDYLPLDAVLARLAARRADQHILVTGRNAKPALIEAADLVTEMTAVKHHFAAGVKAQEGIEF